MTNVVEKQVLLWKNRYYYTYCWKYGFLQFWGNRFEKRALTKINVRISSLHQKYVRISIRLTFAAPAFF